MRRGLATGCALALSLAIAPPAAAQGSCEGSTPNPPTTDPHVTISGIPATAGNELGLGFARTGGGDIVPGSMHYAVDGPAGPASPTPDRYFAAQYTPPVAGAYSVTAQWREYACADYRPGEYRDVTTPAATFTTAAVKTPTVTVRTVSRPKVANAPGHSTLEAFLNCPPRRRSDRTPTVLAVYYTTNGRAPTHASQRTVLDVPDGCWGGTRLRPRNVSAGRVRIAISRALIAFEVTAPGRADVLMEISYGGRLLKSVRARFRPSQTGEGVRRVS